MHDLAVDMIIEGGIGLVNPNQAADFYEEMHSYLPDVGISGVKVDVIHVSLLFFVPLFSYYSSFFIRH